MFFGDWEDEAYYSYTANHDLISWAWEFIRRNPEYQDYCKRSGKVTLPEVAKKFGFAALCDPRHHDNDDYFRQDLNPKFTQSFLDMPTTREKVTVIFDLTKDIRKQANAAKMQLAELQKELNIELPVTKQRNNEWKLYLRVLDANNSGTPRKESSKIIYSKHENPESAYSDALQGAKLLSKNGYRKLLRAAGFKLFS